ncbi:hypothetical protein E2P81_ATG00483 [Venturia nashicola]|nr:hypothetical protein E2P81_ATG00483 [Venturia nashicola]
MNAATQMPCLLTTDNFHTYILKVTTIGPFQPYQIQLLCVDLEEVHKAAVAIKKYLAVFMETMQKDLIKRDFAHYNRLGTVEAFERPGGSGSHDDYMAATIEFERGELQPEPQTIACLESLPKVHNGDEFEDYFTEIFNAACHNQGLADEESGIWSKFELPGPPSFTMKDVITLTKNTVVYTELKDIYAHAQIARAWLSKVSTSHGLNEDAADGDEKVLRAFLLLHDVEGFPLLEDFCNKDKKDWEMVQWIMQPMIKVLQEGSTQLYLLHRWKWLVLPPGLAKRGRRGCPAIPAIPAVWRYNEVEVEEEVSTTESIDEIEVEGLVQDWEAKWPSAETPPEAYLQGILSVAFHIDAKMLLEFGNRAGPSSFTETDILALPNSKPEVWEELKDILGHARVLDAWLKRTADGEPVDMMTRKFCTEDVRNWEMLRWIIQPLDHLLEDVNQRHFLFRQKKWMLLNSGDEQADGTYLERNESLSISGIEHAVALSISGIKHAEALSILGQGVYVFIARVILASVACISRGDSRMKCAPLCSTWSCGILSFSFLLATTQSTGSTGHSSSSTSSSSSTVSSSSYTYSFTSASALAASSPSRSGISGGAITGIVIAILAALALLSGVFFLFFRKKKQKSVALPQDEYEADVKVYPGGPESPGQQYAPQELASSDERFEMPAPYSKPAAVEMPAVGFNQTACPFDEHPLSNTAFMGGSRVYTSRIHIFPLPSDQPTFRIHYTSNFYYVGSCSLFKEGNVTVGWIGHCHSRPLRCPPGHDHTSF